jgi:glycosyltransferase involved in cell wall biosynthesis
MKIAVIDPIGNYGGGSRVVRALLPALKRVDPALEMDYFGNPAAIRRERFVEEFGGLGIQVHGLRSQWLQSLQQPSLRLLSRGGQLIQSRWLSHNEVLPSVITGNVRKELESRIKGYDLAFFPWPFLMRMPRIGCPVVGIFHDFNYKYYFSGAPVFTAAQYELLEREIPIWLETAIPVVSSRFMECEITSFYPEVAGKTRVIHLPSLGRTSRIDSQEAQAVVRELGIHPPYLLCPTHLCSHKNTGPLFAALRILRDNGRELSLVLTGAGTDVIKGVASQVGVLREPSQRADVLGVGYVSNHQMDCLLQSAVAVVNPSLYEAGNGPGVDAWGLGTPVVMSDIPAFREHLHQLGVHAQLFDPHSASDIAAKISWVLDNPDLARKYAEASRAAILGRTWEGVAAEYSAVFHDALALHAV